MRHGPANIHALGIWVNYTTRDIVLWQDFVHHTHFQADLAPGML